MTVREEVRAFAELGPLPAEDTAGVDEVREAQELLLESFGDDTCFGLAWTLLHLIEKGPNPAVRAEPPDGANWWIKRLRQRAKISSQLPDHLGLPD